MENELNLINEKLENEGKVNLIEFQRYLQIKETILSKSFHENEKQIFLIENIESIINNKSNPTEYIHNYYRVTKTKKKLNTVLTNGDDFDLLQEKEKVQSETKNFGFFKKLIYLNTNENLKKEFGLYSKTSPTKEIKEESLIKERKDNRINERNTISQIEKSSQSNSIEKIIEEEIQSEIFNYTRKMKSYAKNFSEIISKDNKKLDHIEKVQNKEKTKTDLQMKSLNDFNHSLKIGFWRLLTLIAIVFATFIFMLAFIKLTPKLF